MTRSQIIELMAQTIAEGHHERGLSAFAEATDVFDKLHAAGLAILPVEPSEEMVVAGGEGIDDYYNGAKDAPFFGSISAAYRAMITAAIKERGE